MSAHVDDNRFLKPSAGLRIAACVAVQHPVREHLHAYRCLDELARELGAELTVFHHGVADLRELPDAERGRVHQGLLVPVQPAGTERPAADVAHFERVAPRRLETVVDRIADAFGASPGAARDLDVARVVCAYARWMQALGVDLVQCWSGARPTVFGILAAHLAGVPAVAFGAATPDPAVAWQRLAAHARGLATTVLSPPDDAPARTATRIAAAVRPAVASTAHRLEIGVHAAFAGPVSAPWAHPTARPFVIVAAERTGSTMIQLMLDSHPRAVCGGELFNPRLRSTGMLDWPLRRIRSRTATIGAWREAPAACLDALFDDAARHGARAVGFKLLHDHGWLLDDAASWLLAAEGLHVIDVRRRDPLARRISRVRAQRSDSWDDVGALPTDPSSPVELGVVPSITDFLRTELMEERYEALTSGARRLRLDYEDFTVAPEAAAEKLTTFLGLRARRLRVRTRKSGDRQPRVGVTDLDALRDACQGTRWQSLFGTPRS
ncbi:MAG: sulfotransferase [Planctomycetes bacterium]|nr:sulfotransferase [Planctomycetota bacterium]